MKTPLARPHCHAIVTETWYPQVNGVANTLRYLGEGLLGRGHRLQVVRPAQIGEVPGPAADGELHQLLVSGLPVPGDTTRQFGLPAYRRLLSYWQQQRPDSVYLATEGPLGWSGLRAARRLGIPVISGFHASFPQYDDHRLGLLSRPASAYLRWFHNQTLITLSTSSTQLHELARMGITNAMLLGRGVDCDLFHPARRSIELRQRWGAAEEDLVLLHAGPLTAGRNFTLLQRSWQYAQQQPPSIGRLHMVVAGEGPQQERLQQHMPGALFTGTLTGSELATAYASADILMFPCLTDSFAHVVTEAMASGLAVVAFDTAHQPIRDRYGGCLAPPGDEQQFLRNLGWLLKDREGLRGIRIHARHRACQLDWGTVLQRFEGYLQRYCAGPERTAHSQPMRAMK